MFKRTKSGKTDVQEAPCIEVCLNTKIQEKYNLAPKTSPFYYTDMLLSIKKISRVKINAVLSLIGIVVEY